MMMVNDRYDTICNPLYYLTIMNCQVCILLLLASWAGGFSHILLQVISVYILPYCGPNVIDHFACDMYPFIGACRHWHTDTYFFGFILVANNRAMPVVVFIFFLVDYGIILNSHKKYSQEGRHKALSIWRFHIIVFVFLILCIFMYVRLVFIDKYITVFFFTILNPMLNPLIYALRNLRLKIV